MLCECYLTVAYGIVKVIGHTGRLRDGTACPRFLLVLWKAQFTDNEPKHQISVEH